MLDENIVAELVERKVISETFRRLPRDKKGQIYEAVIQLFGKYGYDGLAVDRLCREAGISKGSFFQYFQSKSHLLEFAILVFDDYLSKWVDELRQHEKTALARERLLYLYRSFALSAGLNPSEQRFYLFVTHALDHAGVLVEGIDLEAHFRDYVRDIVERGVETGEIRRDSGIDVTEYMVSIVIEALVRHHFSGRRIPHRQMEEYLVSFLFDGVKA